MMYFDIDELTVLELFDCDSRQECLDNMRAALPELEGDREMFDLVISVIGKVEDMTDKDYLDLNYSEAVFEGYYEDDDSDYDEYAFASGLAGLHSPVDFIWVDSDYNGSIPIMKM